MTFYIPTWQLLLLKLKVACLAKIELQQYKIAPFSIILAAARSKELTV
jgi:hypothetical protein